MADINDQRPTMENVTQRIPGYRIVRELGRGGMSVLYLAEDLSFPRPRKVALKVLASSLTEDERFRKRFEREAQVLCDLDHPHIIPIYSAGEAGGLLYLAMRYVDSGDLRTLLETHGPLTVEQATSVMSQVADALDAAHASGMVHRDVKPENILVDRRSRTGEHCYLSDFGITKNIISGESFTIARQFIGSVYYAAPEQIEGGQVDGRADVYALGCVLYQCLTGQVPFPRDDTAAVLMAHVSVLPPSVRDLRPELPAEVDDIVAKAMAKKPEDRYATCGELATALRQVTPPMPPPPGPDRPTVVVPSPILPPPPPEPPRRRRWPLVVGALALFLAGALVAAWQLFDYPNRSERALLTRVPAAFRDTCGRDRQRPAPEGTQAAVRCAPEEGADAVAYASFASGRELGAAYEQVVRDAGVEQNTPSDCETNDRAEHTYEGSPRVSGRVLCYRETGSSHLVWTHAEAQVLATATRVDGESPEVYDWWRDLVDRPAFPTPDEQTILDVIPEASRVSCHHAHGLDQYPGAVAGVQCVPRTGAQSVTYYRFTDLPSLNAVHDERVRELNPPDAWCGSTPPGFRGQGTYNQGGPTVGRVVCHTSAQGDALIEWTQEDLLILTVASSRDPNALAQWWTNDAGPISPEPGFTEAEQALLGHIPLSSRTDCAPLADAASLVTGATVGVQCSPTSGADIVEYFQFPDLASLQAYYTSEVAVTGAPAEVFCGDLPPGFLGEAGYTVGGVPAGRVLCFTNSESEPQIDWTHERLLIFARAAGPEPNELVVWWSRDGGPQ